MHAKARILIVEDEPSGLNLFRYLLTDGGYSVATAQSGPEAMEKLTEGFDLVLTGLKMKDMDGMEMLELVKERSPDTAVIVVTGYATLDSAIEAIRRGADDYINRVTSITRLLPSVEKALKNRKLQQQSIEAVKQQAVDEMVSTTVSGNLRDMSLTSIIQIICTDMKSAKLVLRQPNSMPGGEEREGVIFFENGQIVHSAVGSLRGTEAVYELLDWDEGFFQMESNVVAPRQTITVPWTHLLLESTSRLDEQRQKGATLSGQLEADNHAPPDSGDGLADIERNEEADEEREVELLSLLSTLEQSLVRLAVRKGRDKPRFTLEMLADDVNKLLELYQNRFPDASTDSFLRESLVTVAKSYPMIRLVQTRKGCLDVSTLKRLHSNWSGGQPEREAVYTEVIEGLLHLLELMLTGTVTEAIKSPAVVRRCREVYDVFLNDLEREVKGKL
ncbi:MAG: response regulator [Anaerolineales bacterium]|nr:MAG: response regulator [Anaerolineales bacterium]